MDVRKPVCYAQFSEFARVVSNGTVLLPADAPARVLDLKVINQPHGTLAFYTAIYLYANASYGGAQYALTMPANKTCLTTQYWVWNNFGSFDNQTTSMQLGSNCTQGTLFWDAFQGQPSYAFTGPVSNVGPTFNDQASSARAKR